MSLVIRYVNDKKMVSEDFLEFISCKEGVTGESLSTLILDAMDRHGLKTTYLRGQGYDGAGNMAGSVREVQARIKAKHPKAVYFHCASHKLNLVIVGTCKIPAIRNAMGIVTKVSHFFQFSPKRQVLLEKKVGELPMIEESERRRTKLLGLSFIHSYISYTPEPGAVP